MWLSISGPLDTFEIRLVPPNPSHPFQIDPCLTLPKIIYRNKKWIGTLKQLTAMMHSPLIKFKGPVSLEFAGFYLGVPSPIGPIIGVAVPISF